MKISKTKNEKVLGALYYIKTMHGKKVNMQRDLKLGYAYEKAIRDSGLFHTRAGVVNWVHPNGISDALVKKIISQAYEIGKHYNQTRVKKLNESSTVQEILIEPDSNNLIDIVKRLEAKIDTLVNALL